MFKIESLDKWKNVFMVKSPVTCERNLKSFMEAIKGEISIDERIYKPIGLEYYCLGGSIKLGEKIGVVI